MSQPEMLKSEQDREAPSSSSLKYSIPVSILAIGILAYTAYDSFNLSGYGENASELSYIEKADPRALSGGDLTHFKFGDGSFAEEAVNLPWKLSKAFDDGDGHFERPFRMAASNSLGGDADGLGPLFNAKSCESCHFSDGRSLPVPGQSMLIRLSVPGRNEHGGPKPHPVYGGQFGDHAVEGVLPEGTIDLNFTEIPGTYGDGEPFSLRKPIIKLVDLGYGPLGDDIMTSTRVASSVFGLGLLEAIPEKTIVSWADPEDRDGDGISGKVNTVYDAANAKMGVGRFGWKAESTSIINQSADAASNDMGITTPIFGDQQCTDAQKDCKNALSGGTMEDPSAPEFEGNRLRDLGIYLAFLSVPARGHLDNQYVIKGESLFNEVGCASCHIPALQTGETHEFRRLHKQNIQPFTDLLLHDMGEGLADNRPSYAANGQEWRTAPLWGIGMVETVNGHTNFLHDGRARGFEEAILWHGGEADASKEAFRMMKKADRVALVKFLRSL